MRFIADLHIHSRYSRATSKEISPETIGKWAQFKGLTVVGTGDFTHPEWLKELKQKMSPAGNGLFRLRKRCTPKDVPHACKADVLFALSTEISCIYPKRGKIRKVHCLVLVPDLADATRINTLLSKKGNLSSDGRPILGLDAQELLKIVLDSCPEALFVPAHAWTPHFSVFGAVSGFDSLEECFDDLTPHVYAIETGLSSDPSMNWRLSALDTITLISNSDAHSPAKIGREANIFDTDISYTAMARAIQTKKGFLGTIEFFPEEGKYHFDGHRACGVCLSPKETTRHGGLCPVCGKKLTVGVMHRVEELADRADGYTPEGAPSFHSLIPLHEVIAETLAVGSGSKVVLKEYFRLLSSLGNEFTILMNTPLEEIQRGSPPRLSEAVSRMRSGAVNIAPGFDGEYGKIRIFEELKKKDVKGQKPLF